MSQGADLHGFEAISSTLRARNARDAARSTGSDPFKGRRANKELSRRFWAACVADMMKMADEESLEERSLPFPLK